jgi:cysteine desulfurase
VVDVIKRSYLDAASSEPLHPAAREVLLAAVDAGWADPSRLHHEGRTARLLRDNAREVLADALGIRPDELYLTTSGTTAIHAGLAALTAARRRIGDRILHSAVEHSAVLHAAARAGTPVEIGVDSLGRVDAAAFTAALSRGTSLAHAGTGTGAGGNTGAGARPDRGLNAGPGVGAAADPGASADLTTLSGANSGSSASAGPAARPGANSGTSTGTGGVAVAALQSANHEVGTRQPIEEIARACRAADVPLLVDAAASIGRDDVPAGWSALTASAHKWGGPAGVGLLAVRKGTRLAPGWPIEEREDGLSPGHPDIPALLAAAAALQARRAEADELGRRHRAWIDELRRRVAADVPDVDVVGDPDDRLPHVLTFSCLYVDGEALVTALDAAGFAVSSGSACTASTLRPSHVLAAMGVLTHGNVRVSLGRTTTYEEVDRFAAVLPGLVRGIRAEVGM